MTHMNYVDVPGILKPHRCGAVSFVPETLHRDDLKHLAVFRAETKAGKPVPFRDLFVAFYKCGCCDHMSTMVITGGGDQHKIVAGGSRAHNIRQLRQVCETVQGKANRSGELRGA